jgi:hypothetical protein
MLLFVKLSIKFKLSNISIFIFIYEGGLEFVTLYIH